MTHASEYLTHEEKMVLGWCGDSQLADYGMSGFSTALMTAFQKADAASFAALAAGFPKLAEAWCDYRAGTLTSTKPICDHIIDEDVAIVARGLVLVDSITGRGDVVVRDSEMFTSFYAGDPGDENDHPSAA